LRGSLVALDSSTVANRWFWAISLWFWSRMKSPWLLIALTSAAITVSIGAPGGTSAITSGSDGT
ncbi:hypothetical protein A2U01_0113802, partial [Trifolium medium]|nr:hypothetical protein [Trifolium medium]